QIRHNAMGSTNFQSVIDELIRVRTQNPNIPLEEFPKVILGVSDMQFNPTDHDIYGRRGRTTNHEAALKKLNAVGLNPSFIFWQVNGSYAGDVPVKMDEPGVHLISGFDPAIVTAILGGEQTVVDT